MGAKFTAEGERHFPTNRLSGVESFVKFTAEGERHFRLSRHECGSSWGSFVR
jgi:hypothetical protein